MTATLGTVSHAISSSAISAIAVSTRWSVERFLASPLAVSGLLLATGLTLMAGTNALFFQEMRHPAPMFGGQNAYQAAPASTSPVVIEPETVPSRPVSQPVVTQEPVERSVTSAQDTAPVDPESPPIGNQDIADIQAKLIELGLFDGTVDGYYGPKTADAIRAFEDRNGLPRTGAATPQVIQAIKSATVPMAQSQPQSTTAAEPAMMTSEPTAEDVAPLIAQMQEDAEPVRAATVTTTQPAVARSDPAGTTTPDPVVPAALNSELVEDIQRGLARLGFLQGGVNGVADETTARAIRKFQIFNNYTPTGEVSLMLRDMLVNAGAYL